MAYCPNVTEKICTKVVFTFNLSRCSGYLVQHAVGAWDVGGCLSKHTVNTELNNDIL